MATTGTVSIIVGDDSVSSSAALGISGSGSVELADDVVSALGTRPRLDAAAIAAVPASVPTIRLGTRVARVEFRSIGWLVTTGQASIQLEDDTVSATATLGNTGSASISLADDVVSATGSGGWYADSVAGNDSNSGRFGNAPLRTLTALLAKPPVAGETVHLAGGSTFRAELTGLVPGVTVQPYGAGARPIVDGRDVASAGAFTKTGGRTNVYQIAWTHGFDSGGGKCQHRAWEAGAMMRRVAWTGNLSNDLATLDALPGGFLANIPTAGGPDTIYIHPIGNTDPRSDGKQYQFTQRRWAVQLYASANQAIVYSVDTIGNAHADGSLCIDGYVEDSYARDGRVHNAFILGTAVDCHAIGIDIYDPSGDYAQFVTYYDISSTGPSQRNVIYRRCVADTGIGYTQFGSGFFVHTDGTRQFGTMQYETCNVIGSDIAYGGTNADVYIYYKCQSSLTRSTCNSFAWQRVLMLGGSYTTITGNNNAMLYALTVGPDQAITVQLWGVKYYRQNGGIGPLSFDCPNCFLNVTRCTFVNADSSGVFSQFQSGHFTWNRNITTGHNQTPVTLGKTAAQVGSYDADYNVHYPTVGGVAWGSQVGSHADYIGLPAWQAYLNAQAIGTGREAHTVTNVNPQLVDPANGDFTVQNATVIAMGAGAEQNEENDPELQALWNLYKVA